MATQKEIKNIPCPVNTKLSFISMKKIYAKSIKSKTLKAHMNYFWAKCEDSHSISEFIDKEDLEKTWVSKEVSSAAGNMAFPWALVLSGIAKIHTWLSAFWSCSKLGPLHWRQRVLSKGSWTHLNAVGKALVLPLLNLFAYCKWQGITTELLMPTAL